MAVPKARTVIRERYRLETMIGEGGMASVWRARDLTLARSVALKLLFARDDRDQNALTARFLREARIAASVQHRNVIQIVDFGTTEDELPFMVMELLEGEPLSGRMHRERQLPVADVVQIANLTLRGLSAVHTAGIIHRDLKPDNIYLKRENDSVYPKILDFGISRSVEPQSGRRSALTTRDGLIIGTPEYMSPEQARGVKDIDPRTDLYSMGVIMYEALTGRLPFHNENVGDLIIQVVTGTAPTVHELMPEIPLEISKVIERAMARRREERFSNAAEMQAALLDAASRADLRSTRVLSDMPQLDEQEGSGERRLGAHERATLEDPDSLPARPQVVPPTRASTSDGTQLVPPVTQTLKTAVYGSHRQPHPRNKYILPLVAAGAVIYSTIVLVHASRRDAVPPNGPVSAAESKAAAGQLPAPPVESPPPASARAAVKPPTAKPGAIEVVVGNEIVKPKPTEPSAAKRPRPAAKPATPKLRKAQGALRNLDF
ncbi:MAG TPA: serine/threonine-protein kinase [Polyangiales bacterium]|nr:serine/threonine-protein kinase [Polyangiales bacterium]